jgi:hypothetical protein
VWSETPHRIVLRFSTDVSFRYAGAWRDVDGLGLCRDWLNSGRVEVNWQRANSTYQYN